MSNIRNETCTEISKIGEKINNNWHDLCSYVWPFEWLEELLETIRNNFFFIV